MKKSYFYQTTISIFLSALPLTSQANFFTDLFSSEPERQRNITRSSQEATEQRGEMREIVNVLDNVRRKDEATRQALIAAEKERDKLAEEQNRARAALEQEQKDLDQRIKDVPSIAGLSPSDVEVVRQNRTKELEAAQQRYNQKKQEFDRQTAERQERITVANTNVQQATQELQKTRGEVEKTLADLEAKYPDGSDQRKLIAQLRQQVSDPVAANKTISDLEKLQEETFGKERNIAKLRDKAEALLRQNADLKTDAYMLTMDFRQLGATEAEINDAYAHLKEKLDRSLLSKYLDEKVKQQIKQDAINAVCEAMTKPGEASCMTSKISSMISSAEEARKRQERQLQEAGQNHTPVRSRPADGGSH